MRAEFLDRTKRYFNSCLDCYFVLASKKSSSFLFFSVLITFATILMIAANLAFYSKIRRHEQRMSLFRDLRSKVIYLDEVLTMSARLAVISGQKQWVRLYQDHEILLDHALYELLTEFAEIELSEETNEANKQLVILEKQSIGLLKKRSKSRS